MKLINADCIEAMKAMPDNSVDSIVTDPPYELGFMGKSWDATGIAFNVEVWEQALRVLKPGGHLLAFSGTRTYHRMAVAIEDAGFQIRDQIMWVYGSGFPKSMNIGKALEAVAQTGSSSPIAQRRAAMGDDYKKTPLAGTENYGTTGNFQNKNTGNTVLELTDEHAKQWEGWGTALKPAHEPIVLARKPMETTVANNVLTYGVGGLNIDGSRIIATGENFDNLKSRPIGKLNTRRNEETDDEFDSRVNESPEQLAALAKLKELGRWPANFIHDGSDEVVGMFPETKATGSGKVSGFRKGGASENSVGLAGVKNAADGFSDSGSAARFFYCAKTGKRDRNDGLDGFEVKRPDTRTTTGMGTFDVKGVAAQTNHHPTVKPTALMQYLVKLVTPPKGIVLDPFMGSGSTGKACVYEGFDFIGIDQSDEYVAIAQARIDYAVKDKEQNEVDDRFLLALY